MSSVSARIAAREDPIALEEERHYEEEKGRKKEGPRSVGGGACPRYIRVLALFFFLSCFYSPQRFCMHRIISNVPTRVFGRVLHFVCSVPY